MSAATLEPTDLPERSSLFVDGDFPRRRALVLLLSLLGGLLVAYAWSARTADDTIGFNTANTLLGHDAHKTPITSIAAGVLFAFVTGLAGSFTACTGSRSAWSRSQPSTVRWWASWAPTCRSTRRKPPRASRHAPHSR
ncbi:MAG: hypothetical protein JF587_23480 [Catenulisporales bacterium]|nr:hypothetical protein [Catenulisporales bacterium]